MTQLERELFCGQRTVINYISLGAVLFFRQILALLTNLILRHGPSLPHNLSLRHIFLVPWSKPSVIQRHVIIIIRHYLISMPLPFSCSVT